VVDGKVQVGEHVGFSCTELGCHRRKAWLENVERMLHGVTSGLTGWLQEDRLHDREHCRACSLGTALATLRRKCTLQRCQVAPANTWDKALRSPS